MTYTTTDVLGIRNPFDGFFTSLRESAVRYREYRTVRAELEAMTTRELNDIGLSRGDIHAVASGTYRR